MGQKRRCTSSCHVSNHRHTCQRTRPVQLMNINDVLIAVDEDAQDPISEQDTCGKRRPIRYRRSSGPAHPEHTDWDCWSAKHSEPQPEPWWQTATTFHLYLGKVPLRPHVNQGQEERLEAESDSDSDER